MKFCSLFNSTIINYTNYFIYITVFYWLVQCWANFLYRCSYIGFSRAVYMWHVYFARVISEAYNAYFNFLIPDLVSKCDYFSQFITYCTCDVLNVEYNASLHLRRSFKANLLLCHILLWFPKFKGIEGSV